MPVRPDPGTRRGACAPRHRLTLPFRHKKRGCPPALPVRPCLRFNFLSPSPRPPSPPGKGEPLSLFSRGLRPRHPCTAPGAARAFREVSGTRRGACPGVSGTPCDIQCRKGLAPAPTASRLPLRLAVTFRNAGERAPPATPKVFRFLPGQAPTKLSPSP